MGRPGKKILIVDDDDAIRALLHTVLRRRGYHVDTARNGAEALERLAECNYALVLLDLMMPVMSGWDVLDHLRSATLMHRPLVLVLTAGIEARKLESDLVVGLMQKPFEVELLVDTIQGCMTITDEGDENCPQPAQEPAGDAN